MMLITTVVNENKKYDTMEEMLLTSQKSSRCKDPKMPHLSYYSCIFYNFFQSRIHTMKNWYVNFSSPYVDSSISANYMVDVDIYIHASVLSSWSSIVSIATRLWAGWSGV